MTTIDLVYNVSDYLDGGRGGLCLAGVTGETSGLRFREFLLQGRGCRTQYCGKYEDSAVGGDIAGAREGRRDAPAAPAASSAATSSSSKGSSLPLRGLLPRPNLIALDRQLAYEVC